MALYYVEVKLNLPSKTTKIKNRKHFLKLNTSSSGSIWEHFIDVPFIQLIELITWAGRSEGRPFCFLHLQIRAQTSHHHSSRHPLRSQESRPGREQGHLRTQSGTVRERLHVVWSSIEGYYNLKLIIFLFKTNFRFITIAQKMAKSFLSWKRDYCF